jgi:predicted 3-demethylubiquinone-9 3-methyltransferase (glyoxalase superfamily)
MQTINPCLWFDKEAEEAADFYMSIFKNSRVHAISRYGEAGKEFHGKPAGSVMTVEFEINGQTFTALNGGPQFKFNEAISFQVMCDNQQEVDYYWDKLSAGGDPDAQACGWLKDKYGVSWQIVPVEFIELVKDRDPQRMQRAMQAMFGMKKLDLAALKRAADGA